MTMNDVTASEHGSLSAETRGDKASIPQEFVGKGTISNSAPTQAEADKRLAAYVTSARSRTERSSQREGSVVAMYRCDEKGDPHPGVSHVRLRYRSANAETFITLTAEEAKELGELCVGLATTRSCAGEERGSDPVIHASDCALHNAPAYPVGPCDCGALSGVTAQSTGLSPALRAQEVKFDHASPRPWNYENRVDNPVKGMADWIEDATGSVVLSNVGHIDGPLICAAVNGYAPPLILESGNKASAPSAEPVTSIQTARKDEPAAACTVDRTTPFMWAIFDPTDGRRGKWVYTHHQETVDYMLGHSREYEITPLYRDPLPLTGRAAASETLSVEDAQPTESLAEIIKQRDEYRALFLDNCKPVAATDDIKDVVEATCEWVNRFGGGDMTADQVAIVAINAYKRAVIPHSVSADAPSRAHDDISQHIEWIRIYADRAWVGDMHNISGRVNCLEKCVASALSAKDARIRELTHQVTVEVFQKRLLGEDNGAKRDEIARLREALTRITDDFLGSKIDLQNTARAALRQEPGKQ
jgi:hypothetical protein